MTPNQILIIRFYIFILTVWTIRRLALLYILPRLDRVSLSSPKYAEPNPPLVTAIIPAKDEEKAIDACLRSVRAQNYPRLSILVVNDRSKDGTAAIAEKQGREDPRVRVITINELPDGWTGKTHALDVASKHAEGDWFWFVDADTLHEPDSLAISLEYARQKGATLMSLLPRMRAESFWERIMQPLCSVVLMQSYPPIFTNHDKFKTAFANGQYILIRKDTYEAIGGHMAVRNKFVEDIHLARLAKAKGFVTKTAIGPEISSTRMYTSLDSILRGWSRILYDALDRKWWLVAAKILDPIVFTKPGTLALPIGLWLVITKASEPFSWWILLIAVVHYTLCVLVLRKLYGLCSPPGTREALWYPVASVMVDVVLIKALMMCFTGKVTWRGTQYGSKTVVDPVRKSL